MHSILDSIFWSILERFLFPTSTPRSWKIEASLQRGLYFRDSGGRSWKKKSTNNPLKNRVQDGMHLGIDFWAILVDFECQVGMKNQTKINQKCIEKRCEKKEQQECQKSRNKNLQPRATGRVLSPGDETVEMEPILLDTLLTVHICMPTCFCTQVS